MTAALRGPTLPEAEQKKACEAAHRESRWTQSHPVHQVYRRRLWCGVFCASQTEADPCLFLTPASLHTWVRWLCWRLTWRRLCHRLNFSFWDTPVVWFHLTILSWDKPHFLCLKRASSLLFIPSHHWFLPWIRQSTGRLSSDLVWATPEGCCMDQLQMHWLKFIYSSVVRLILCAHIICGGM